MPDPLSAAAPRELDPIFATREFDVPAQSVSGEPTPGPSPSGLVNFDEEEHV